MTISRPGNKCVVRNYSTEHVLFWGNQQTCGPVVLMHSKTGRLCEVKLSLCFN
jgi:hypothetical protein